MRPILFVLFALLVSLVQQPPAFAQVEVLPPRFANGIPYISGGIGEEELEAIHRARKNYNIKIVLAEASGAYVSGVSLQLSTVLGEPLVSIADAGPLVLVQLPPGSYLITTGYKDRNTQKRFDVSDNVAQTVVIAW